MQFSRLQSTFSFSLMDILFLEPKWWHWNMFSKANITFQNPINIIAILIAVVIMVDFFILRKQWHRNEEVRLKWRYNVNSLFYSVSWEWIPFNIIDGIPLQRLYFVRRILSLPFLALTSAQRKVLADTIIYEYSN